MRPATITLCLLCAPLLCAQTMRPTAIPATAPTQSVSDLPSAHAGSVAAASAAESTVVWNGSLLTIEASGEAMPELLGRVAHETGMKITGGVPDERVYGKYGPAPVQTVLSQLFDGLPINMMLVNEDATKPKELFLTVRSGAATPPSTRQVANNFPSRPPDPVRSLPQALPPGSSAQQPHNPGYGSQPTFPNAAQPAENNASTNSGNAEPDTASSTDSGQPQSPNGVKTPEQIFEELRKRQQQSH